MVIAWESVGGNGLGWAAGMSGDAHFPHNRDVTTDYATVAAATWTDSAGGGAQTFTGKVIAADRLDVDHLLTLQGGPWFIFCATLDFGVAGDISGNGPAGSVAGDNQNADYARGGWVSATGIAAGGAGGVMLFIVAAAITGSNRTVSANGGDGARNTTNATANAAGGQGALSTLRPTAQTVAFLPQRWDGADVLTATDRNYLNTLALLLGAGAGDNTALDGAGGGSGGNDAGPSSGGGSGIGGGARAGVNGSLAQQEATPLQLLELAQRACRGGGGGGASVETVGTNNNGAGGGAGSGCVWGQTLTATPTLSVSGGTGVANGNGAAGVSYLIDVP